MAAAPERLGVWLIGARGAVATTTLVAAAALARQRIRPLGLLTEVEPLARAPLVPLSGLMFGGHDVRSTPLLECARLLCRDAGPLDPALLREVEADLVAVEERIARYPLRTERPLRESVRRLQKDLEDFVQRTGVRRVVVVNLASTEAPVTPHEAHADRARWEALLDAKPPPPEGVVPDSALTAYACLQARIPYVNFTPSTGASLPVLEALALESGVPHAGQDGKTGETLLKSALAPMFRMRQLEVKSWSGVNLLGNADGLSLSDPETARAKVASKAKVVPEILGYEPHSLVRIDYVPTLGDWKTAWDLIQFEGLLGTRMSLELTWRGSDSALAAPLVLDLARLVDLAATRGERGALGYLGFYFKAPVACAVHDLAGQYRLLCEHVPCA